MVTARTDPVPIGRPSFLGAQRCNDLGSLDVDVAVVGVPYTTPADLADLWADCSSAPGALREQSLCWASSLDHYDFDFRGAVFAGRSVRIGDCGDVAMRPGQYEENSRAATAAVRAVLAGGAFPLVLGGDHAAAISALRAFDDRGRLCVVHIGADLDWRDEVNGVRESRSSAMRRAAELPPVASMIQVGLRGISSSRQREVDDARAWGSVLVPAEAVHEGGVRQVLGRVPAADAYYLSLDLGGLDPAIAPGVAEPAFGGLTYFQATDLIRGIAALGRVVGMDVVGIAPSRDLHGLTSLLGVRLSLNLLGALAHAGQLGSPPLDLASDLAASEPSTMLAPLPQLAAQVSCASA